MDRLIIWQSLSPGTVFTSFWAASNLAGDEGMLCSTPWLVSPRDPGPPWWRRLWSSSRLSEFTTNLAGVLSALVPTRVEAFGQSRGLPGTAVYPVMEDEDGTIRTGGIGFLSSLARADNIANYRLLSPRPDFTFDTSDCSGLGGGDKLVPLSSVSYQANSPSAPQATATLLLTEGLIDDHLRLLARSDITDLAGNPLEGGHFSLGGLRAHGHQSWSVRRSGPLTLDRRQSSGVTVVYPSGIAS